MKKYTRKVSMQEAGITLTALVVTIIVMLILAGVTISMVVGDNGIFSRARLAKESYENAALKEGQDLNSLEGWLNGQMDRIDENGEEGEDGTGGITLSQEDYQQLLEGMQTQSNTIKDLQTTVATQGNTISSLSTTYATKAELNTVIAEANQPIHVARFHIDSTATYDKNYVEIINNEHMEQWLWSNGEMWLDIKKSGIYYLIPRDYNIENARTGMTYSYKRVFVLEKGYWKLSADEWVSLGNGDLDLYFLS